MQRHAENGKSKYFVLEINSCEHIQKLYKNMTQDYYAKDIECSDDDEDTKKSIIS